ncbi:hypothetical protein AHF37_01691 [Paragonimus kellicotti]|nr:hypothetical protein AHF37_01691 [Paragonimus kellicotti]
MTTGAQQLSDTEIGKDANVLIMELNKGLQSANLGDQCKAIAQFPNLLEKYPFPVVVNSVSLKIAQVFCDGSNYVRLCILRACSSCRSHLEKLTVCDDIVRKLMPFTASNDPVTRALTLRLFGTLSRSSREHIGVHHAVLKQIESHYGVESDAAIWSSHQLAPLSCAFAVNLCPILCRRLISLSTECEVKLKLLRLGRYMHHDVQIAEQMRECLVNMLSVYNTSEFVTNILDTLTSLASSASIHTCHQLNLLIDFLHKDDRTPVRLNLLIDFLHKDDRTPVRLNALQNLGLLAYRAPHHWEKSHLTKLCSHYVSVDKSPVEREKILHVFYCLACSKQAVDILQACSDNSESSIVFCLKNALLTFPATRLTVKAIQLACKLVLLTAHSGSSDASVQHSLTAETPAESPFSSGLFVCLMAAHFTVGPAGQEAVDGSVNGQLPWFLAPEGISLAALKLTYTLMVQFFDSFPEYASALHKMGLFEHVILSGSDNRWFQAEYVGIRGNLYLCLAELCICANYFTHVGRWSGRYHSRGTNSADSSAVRALAVPTSVVRQLDLWCGLADRLCTLQSQCLDADQTTHGHLYAIIQLVGFFIDVLQSVCDVYGGADRLRYEKIPVSENLSKGDPFCAILQELRQIAQSHMKFNPLRPTNFDWLSYLALQVARVASHWPRFFFQRLQTSTVRLVLLPKAGNNPEDVLTVSSEVGHMVQVMGVVQQRSRLPHGQVARRIHAVEVELTVTTAFSDTPGLHRRGVGDLVFSSIRSARLQRDYFHCEFCVRFPDPAQSSHNTAQRQTNTIYRVSAVAILSDTFGTRWRLTHASGAPIETTLVRVESINNNSSSLPATPTKLTDPADSRVHV